jgi:hypothetical protein
MTQVNKKKKARKPIINLASIGFRCYAYTEVDNDSIAKAARVTLGLFYAYLGSVNCAFEVVLLVGFDE